MAGVGGASKGLCRAQTGFERLDWMRTEILFETSARLRLLRLDDEGFLDLSLRSLSLWKIERVDLSRELW